MGYYFSRKWVARISPVSKWSSNILRQFLPGGEKLVETFSFFFPSGCNTAVQPRQRLHRLSNLHYQYIFSLIRGYVPTLVFLLFLLFFFLTKIAWFWFITLSRYTLYSSGRFRFCENSNIYLLSRVSPYRPYFTFAIRHFFPRLRKRFDPASRNSII